MKRALFFLVVLSILFSTQTFAQRKRTAAAPAKSKAAPAPAPVKVDVQAEATATATSLKALQKFIYLYGRISNGLEIAEEQARKAKLAASVIEKNTENKNGVMRGIGGQKEQIEKLSRTLEANPRLQVQYVNLAGVTQKLGEAMDLVGNNQFDEAGRSLVTAADRLTDILQQIK